MRNSTVALLSWFKNQTYTTNMQRNTCISEMSTFLKQYLNCVRLKPRGKIYV